MARLIKRPEALSEPHNFCPGCGHGIIARLMCEVLAEKGLEKNVIIPIGVGCCCNMRFVRHDLIQCAHGRACAAARGVKVSRPEACVISYQGDGDAYVIGLQETLNAAYNKVNISLITVNNSNFGMTGGQMAWTTLPNQVTTTSPFGRAEDGPKPIKVPEMIAHSLEPAFVARGSVSSPGEIRKTKRYISESIDAQMKGEGFSMVEVLSPCPTNWGLSTEKSVERVEGLMTEFYPLGVIKERAQ